MSKPLDAQGLPLTEKTDWNRSSDVRITMSEAHAADHGFFELTVWTQRLSLKRCTESLELPSYTTVFVRF